MTNLLLMNPPYSFLVAEGWRRQRIGTLQIRGAVRELEGGNPLPPQPPADDHRFIIQPYLTAKGLNKIPLNDPAQF